MLADLVEHVIGVDTHRDTHSAAVIISPSAGLVDTYTVDANCAGYEALLGFVTDLTEESGRVWAIEGTASYGAGLTAFLESCGEWVIEIDRPNREPRRLGDPKTDIDDAILAGRQALGLDKFATPRARGDREALRVVCAARELAVNHRRAALNMLKANLVTAPDKLRSELCAVKISTPRLVQRCAQLRNRPRENREFNQHLSVLRTLARQIQNLDEVIGGYDRDLAEITQDVCPRLLDEMGVGPVNAAQIYIAWSHPGRIRNEAAFAKLGGVAPIEASSGQTLRHRLNRGGDRKLNRALHNIAITRSRVHAPTLAYINKRCRDGKTRREARRCLKRYLARRFYKILENTPNTT